MRVLTFHLSIRERLLITWSHLETLLPQMHSKCGVCWLEEVAWDQPPEAVGGDPHTYVPPPHSAHLRTFFYRKAVPKNCQRRAWRIWQTFEYLDTVHSLMASLAASCDMNNHPVGQHLYVLLPPDKTSGTPSSSFWPLWGPCTLRILTAKRANRSAVTCSLNRLASSANPRTEGAKVQRLRHGVLGCEHRHSLGLTRSRKAWSFGGRSHEAVWGERCW